MKLTPEQISNYFNRPVTTNDQGCWLWQGSIGNHGYAQYSGGLVHGMVWRMAGNTDSLANLDLRHQCRFKNCINPDHLLPGTRSENMMDASRDGTLGRCRRVSDEDIATVRRMLAEGKCKSECARAIGVSPAWMTKFFNGGLKYARA